MSVDLDAQAAFDPTTRPAELARIAQHRPELRAAIAANPAAYPGLLAWLEEQGDPVVNAALQARRAAAGPAGAPAGAVPVAQRRRLPRAALVAIVALSVVAVAGLVLVARALMTPSGIDSNRTYFPKPPTKVWSFAAPSGSSMDSLVTLTEQGTLVYATASPGPRYTLKGINSRTGEEKWSLPLGEDSGCAIDQTYRSRMFACGRSMTDSDTISEVTFYDANTGKSTGKVPISSGRALAISGDRAYLATNPTDGNTEISGYGPSGKEVFRTRIAVADSTDNVSISGTEDGRNLVIRTGDKSVVTDASTGRQKLTWPGSIFADPSGVFFGSKSGESDEICRLDGQGRETWCLEGSAPVVVGATTLIQTGSDETAGVDSTKGTVKWRYHRGLSSSDLAGPLAVTIDDGDIEVLDTASGDVRWNRDVGSGADIIPDGANVIVRLGSSAQSLRAADGKQVWTTSEEIPDAQVRNLLIDQHEKSIDAWVSR